MNHFLGARIAWRYLRAKKSHSAVSAIAAVSVVGVAFATAAIVCVLSVFNGFRNVLAEGYSNLMPDIIIAPAQGKVINCPDSLLDVFANDADIMLATPTLTDNALVIYANREMPVTLKGVVAADYACLTAIDSILYPGGRFIESSVTPGNDTVSVTDDSEEDDGEDFYDPDAVVTNTMAEGVVAVGVASQIALNGIGENLLLFAPRRHGRVNMANPVESFVADSLVVTAVFQANQSDYDDNVIICDLSVAQNLFQYDTEVSAIEIKLRPGRDPASVAQRLSGQLGSDFRLTDRMRQQDINFRMVAIEKWVSFLLLIFILLIASFNLISTMSMLVLEKQSAMPAMRAMGMSRRMVGRVFWWESLYVTFTGGITGIAGGVILCLLQQHFGLIRLAGDPDTLIINAYPVAVEAGDLLLAFLSLFLIGLLTAFIAAGFARSRCDSVS
ncbi:MAG: ABC transporter permease [Muribaculaceae bacterium]|nr:ABC transporter permease [Muribaculaceae bacterium]